MPQVVGVLWSGARHLPWTATRFVHFLMKELPMKLGLGRSLGGLVVVAVALAAGCADLESPTSVGAADRAQPAAASASTSSAPDLTVLARYDAAQSITIAWAKKWIGPEGGRLDFHGFAIDVPAGAVDRLTQFSIRLPVEIEASEVVVAEFGPHGTFSVPVRIELPYAGTSVFGVEATVGWWDADAEAWIDVGGELTADGERLRTSTDHFSTFGTMEQSDGDTVILSGG